MHLAHVVAGETADEADLAWSLVCRQGVGDMVHELGGCCARADNVSDDTLAQVRVGYADDGGFRDGGVVKQARFDLGGTDQVAAGLDEV